MSSLFLKLRQSVDAGNSRRLDQYPGRVSFHSFHCSRVRRVTRRYHALLITSVICACSGGLHIVMGIVAEGAKVGRDSDAEPPN